MLIIATRQAYPSTSTAASDSSNAQRSESASIAASSSFVTFFIRIRDEWKVKRSGAIASRARSSAGISVSIVTFELGTICPMRMGLVITPSDRDDRITQRADALDGAFDRSEEHTSELQSLMRISYA